LETAGNGKLVFDLTLQRSGVNITDMEWNFEEGKLISMTAKKNIEYVSDQMEKATGDKDRISTIGIGLNPKARYGFLMNNIVEGSVAVGIGDNEALGGKNRSPFAEQAEIGRATLEVDGKAIIKNGQLQS
jgi:leucyl aminopeptidase (aminopeptidase T)